MLFNLKVCMSDVAVHACLVNLYIEPRVMVVQTYRGSLCAPGEVAIHMC
jgi:hypothetical protein